MNFRKPPRTRSLQSLGPVLATLSLGLSLGTSFAPAAVAQQGARPTIEPATEQAPIFRFTTDGFLLNLHHFLYVLGRAEAETRDSTRRAVAEAPGDMERGLESLPAEQQGLWRDAVTAYSKGPSQLDSVFDEELYTGVRKLVRAGETLEGVELEASWKAALEQAAPIYRQVWWDEHRASNEAWVEALEPLVAKHGRQVLDFVTRAYGLPWPVDGYPVQVSGYCNWAGAYSTHGNLLVLSSLDAVLRGTSAGLEVVFHEAMHQWDDVLTEELIAAATALRVRFPRGLDHALLFFTVGEAVRTAIPEHVPYAHQYGVWQRSSGVFLPMLQEAWRPYVHGVVPRDEALAALMRNFEKPAEE